MNEGFIYNKFTNGPAEFIVKGYGTVQDTTIRATDYICFIKSIAGLT